MKVAIVYDRINKWGGAERVLLALHELFPDAPLFTAVYSASKAPWASVFPNVIPSFLQKLPFLKDKHELLGTFTPIAFETFSFSEYDLVISVTSEAAKGIITLPNTKHICYCLTPTRYLWSGYDEYFNDQTLKTLSKPAVSYLRKLDLIAAQRPDVMVAISHEVQSRIKKYYGRESAIIFPPVEVDRFNNKKSQTKLPLPKDYYLVVSRLVSYKKVDLVVDYFNETGLPLVIVGIGNEEKKLKAKAKDNIHFAGFVPESVLPSFYKKARALIFAQDEDFGMTAVESMASGTPVIAYKKGGAVDTVVDGKTGVFFSKQSKVDLNDAIKRFKSLRFDSNAISGHAESFSKKKFKDQFTKLVSKVHNNTTLV